MDDLLVEDTGTTVNESRELSLQDWRNSRYGAGAFNAGHFDGDDDLRRMSTYKKAVFAVEVSQRSKRVLSPHVCSRHYRPPEIILLEKDYSETVDVWQFGAILGEMLRVSKPYHTITAGKKGKKVKNNDLALFKDRVLFNGDSSYPLSPKTKLGVKSGFVEKEAHVSQNDMLKKIYSWHKIME